MTPKQKTKWKIEVGSRLRKECERIFGDRKQYRMAKHLRISQGSLSDIITGVSAPSAYTLMRIMLKTDIDIRWLLTGDYSESLKKEIT